MNWHTVTDVAAVVCLVAGTFMSLAAAVARLRDAVASHNRGVAGLDDTLQALVERRVDVFLVSSGFSAPGWRCGGCGWR